MEQRFTLAAGENRIPVWLDEPASGEIRRVVLGVHGFGGSSADEIQTNMAEEMALFGSAVVRFDFPAHGCNPEKELTLAGCVETLTAVAAEAKRREAEARAEAAEAELRAAAERHEAQVEELRRALDAQEDRDARIQELEERIQELNNAHSRWRFF